MCQEDAVIIGVPLGEAGSNWSSGFAMCQEDAVIIGVPLGFQLVK